MKIDLRFILVFAVASLGFRQSNSTTFAFQDATPKSQVAAPGAEQITEGKVTATISFLASDELAGRGTGSPEFNIAAAYVAARFRGAGLESGAGDSYYHETMVRQIRLPSKATVLDGKGANLTNFGPLVAPAKALEWSGTVQQVDLGKLDDAAAYTGAVISTAESAPQNMRDLSRLAAALSKAGAIALLLRTKDDSEFVSQANTMREKTRPESSSRISLPIVMVPESMETITSLQLSIPGNIVTEMPMRNVVGLLKGSDPELAKEAIIFSAHLDHLGANPRAGDGIFNGADDDASGCTGVINLADAFGAMGSHPKRSILFMTFWGEESGLLGSKEFAAKPSWPLDKIVANVNIEMIGRPEPGARGKIWMTGWNESNLGALMSEAAKGTGGEIFEHPKFSAMLYRSSDNWSFVQKGVIAHSFSAGSLHADYHQPDDEWDRLEIPHMTQVIKTLFAASLPLANGEVTPTKKQ